MYWACIPGSNLDADKAVSSHNTGGFFGHLWDILGVFKGHIQGVYWAFTVHFLGILLGSHEAFIERLLVV